MNKVKHILAIFIVLAILAAAAYFLPKTEFGSRMLNIGDSAAEAVSDSAAAQDTTPFVEKFKDNIQVLQSSYSKRKKRDVWTLGKGRTIVYYLLQAQRFLQANGGSVLRMEELHDDPTVFQSATLDAIDPKGDTLKLLLQVSENVFRDNASILSIAFQVTRITPELIVALNGLDFPYDLMVTPFGMGDGFFPDLDRIKNKGDTRSCAPSASTIRNSKSRTLLPKPRRLSRAQPASRQDSRTRPWNTSSYCRPPSSLPKISTSGSWTFP